MKLLKIDKDQKFGYLIATGNKETRKSGSKNKTFCECSCICGKIIWVRASSLLDGDTSSCGCKRKDSISKKLSGKYKKHKDLSGKRFGKLVVSSEYGRFASGKGFVTKWKCICDCGREKWIQSSALLGSTKSCGCFAKQRASEANSIESGLAAKHSIYSQYKIRAKKKKLLFRLTFEEFIELCSNPCSYCGAKASNKCIAEGCNGSFVYNGIDRIDNTQGYIRNNCVTACKVCNRAKDILSKKEFVDWILQAYNHLMEDKNDT